MEKKISFSEILKKYTMVIVLVLVVIMFAVNTKGVMLLPQNVNNLVAQNAYVFILATGMLFCILTGGNIDLSVGSVVCFVAAVGGKMMVLNSMNPYLTMLVMLLTLFYSAAKLPISALTAKRSLTEIQHHLLGRQQLKGETVVWCGAAGAYGLAVCRGRIALVGVPVILGKLAV